MTSLLDHKTGNKGKSCFKTVNDADVMAKFIEFGQGVRQ